MARLSVIEWASVNAVTIFSTATYGRTVRNGSPFACFAIEHGRQQQRDEKQQVIEADRDVEHAVADVAHECLPARCTVRREGLLPMIVRKNGAEHGSVRGVELEQSAMLRVDVEQSVVADSDRARVATRRL